MANRTDQPPEPPTPSQTVAELHAQARKDYGTPEQRAARAADAKVQSALAKAHAQQAASTPKGRR